MQDIHGTSRQYSYIQYSRNIISEYSPEFHRELFLNIPRIYRGNAPPIFHEQIFARCVCVCMCVCVCLYSSTSWFLPAAWRLWHTWDVRNNDLLLWVLLGASAKFLHLHFWVYHISPPKTKVAADSILERKQYNIRPSTKT